MEENNQVTECSLSLADDTTSPSQLQEVTLDQDVTFSNTMGLRSPGGPMRARSVKEIEEQLSNLKKENFNLKLRIYFLEEKMGAHFTLDKDNIVKKYIELQVEYGNLQKELDEKHDLLCQAVKAMELEEEEHKKYVASKEDQLNVCQQELDELRMQLQLHLEKENNASLQFIIGHAETLKTRYENTQKECLAKEATIRNLHEEIETSNSKMMSYVEQLTEMQGKLDSAYRENDALSKRIRGDAKKLDEAAELRRKYANVRAELEREHKLRTAGDERVSELEVEAGKHRARIGELQNRLETEARKNQNQAVLSSPGAPPTANSARSHRDSLSVQEPATPTGAAQAHALHVQVAPSSGGDCSGESEVLRAKLTKLKKEQFKACEIIKTMMASRSKANEEMAQLRRQVKALERELESVVTRPVGEDGASTRGGDAAGEREKSMAKSDGEEEMGIVEHYKALTVELEAKIEILVATLNEKDAQMQNVRKQYEEILICLEEKENRLADMEFELLCTEEGDASRSFSEKHNIHEQEIEEKDKRIEALTEDLRKCTCHLQEIVNKELWDKNKEIEKLHNKYSNTSDSCKLKKELTQREDQIEKLSTEITNLRIENERSEKLRRESNEVCGLLNSRLEELALFLDSLLKNKSVLGFLGLQKEKRLRGLINSSLDISKSFATSMMVPGDQTLAQLSNITALLDGSEFHLSLNQQEDNEDRESFSIVPSDITLTYQSHLYKSSKKENPDSESVILALREQIVNLKSELQLRDNELNKLNVASNRTSDSEAEPIGFSKLFLSPVRSNTTSTTLKYRSECHSESEGWSEPDRVVSRARIGLSQTAPDFSSGVAKNFGESTEEESAFSLTPTKKRNLDYFELQEEIKKRTEELALAEAKLAQSVDGRAFEELERRLAEAEAGLAEARQRKEEAEIKMDLLQRTVEDLNREKEILKETVTGKDKEIKDLLNAMEVEKAEAKRIAEGFEREAIEAKRDIEERDLKLKEVREEMEMLEARLRNEYERFAVAEEEFLKQLRLAEDNVKQLEDRYAREYVKKSEVEDKLVRVEQLLTEMDDLKAVVSSYEETLRSYKEENGEMAAKLGGYQDAVNDLRKELDTTTLQYSEAVLEKTKLASAKAALEQELDRHASRDSEMQQQMAEIRAEFDKVNESCQGQISGLQRQKSQLEVRLSEMESANAQLHNRLVKLQASRNDFNLSLPSYNSRGTYRQYPDVNYPCDDRSEDHNVSAAPHPAARPMPPPMEVERREANSSPDLGIESDHGRFSSLETHSNNVQRPLLQTLELTESMSNLLDGEGHLENVGFCESDHCCRRTTAFAQENAELKRKLLRMRRALEETATQLNLANQRKKQVEKVICKQIHKTSQVLRKAKANLDSGSESDLLNK